MRFVLLYYIINNIKIQERFGIYSQDKKNQVMEYALEICGILFAGYIGYDTLYLFFEYELRFKFEVLAHHLVFIGLCVMIL